MWYLALTLLFSLFSAHLVGAFPRYFGKRFSDSNRLNLSGSNVDTLNLGNLIGIIPTTIGPTPIVVAGRKRIPDQDHPFMAPGPTDVRGGCPGLNIMANYGYISRDGITNINELLFAMQEMLGFAPDLSLFLVGLGLKTSVDLTTLKISIGKTDPRTDGALSRIFGTALGLFAPQTHNKFEIDGSLAIIDAYFAKGETDQFSSDRWRKYRQLAVDQFGGIMTTKFIGAARFMQYNECRYHNPDCHWAVLDQLALYAAQAFTSTAMTSADEEGNPLAPDLKSIDRFFGFIENPDGSFTREYSRLPLSRDGHYYRRTVPLTFAQQVATLTDTLLAYPVEFGRNNGTLGYWNSDLTQIPNILQLNIACYLLQQTRDPKDSIHANNSTLNAALGVLLQDTLQPLFKELSC